MIHADDPLGRGVEKQDLPGVFLLYGGEIQIFTADADFLLIFVRASGHTSVLFLGVDEIT